VNAGKRIGLKESFADVGGHKATRVVARNSERRLGQIIRSEAEKVSMLGDLVRRQRGPWKLDHRSDQILELHTSLCLNFKHFVFALLSESFEFRLRVDE